MYIMISATRQTNPEKFKEAIVMKYEFETIKYNGSLPAKIETKDVDGGLFSTDLHWHKEIELLYIIDGSVTVEKYTDEYTLGSGDVFLFNSGEIHRISAESDDRIKAVSLHLSYEFVKKFDSQIDFSSFVLTSGSLAQKEITGYMNELADETLSAFQQYAVIMNILHVLFSNCIRERQISLYGNCKVNFRNAKVAMEYIEEHYREELSLNVMAEIVGLNPIYFSKYFKDATGMGFNAYVNTVRLKHALDDLIISGLSIADAANYNGFPNVKSFENACKRSYGLTPLQFKKRQLMVS